MLKFGRLAVVDTIGKEIQPVWVKVENHWEETYYLLTTAADPNYFSPLETAYAVSSRFNKAYRDQVERHFRSMNFRNPILPNTAVSGFIFTTKTWLPVTHKIDPDIDDARQALVEDLFFSQTVTKVVFEDLDGFRQQHPALTDLTKEGMLKGLTAPFHRGAVKYFKEAGLME